MNRRLFLGSLASLPIALLASPGGVYQGPRRVVRVVDFGNGAKFEVYDLRDLSLRAGEYTVCRYQFLVRGTHELLGPEGEPDGWMLDKFCTVSTIAVMGRTIIVSPGALA